MGEFTTVSPNGVYLLEAVVESGGKTVVPDYVDWSLSGATDSRTSVSNTGVLKIGPAEAGTGGKITVKADAGGEPDAVELTVDPQGVPYWPGEPGKSGGAGLALKLTDNDGRTVTTASAGDTIYVEVVGATSGGTTSGCILGTAQGSYWMSRPAEMFPVVGMVKVAASEASGTVITVCVEDTVLGAGTAQLTIE